MTETVLVAGATGIVGRALVERLASQGNTVLALSRSANRALFPQPPVIPIAADLTNTDSLHEKLYKHAPAYVFYCAQFSKNRPFPIGAREIQPLLKVAHYSVRPLLQLLPSLQAPFNTLIAAIIDLADSDDVNLAMLTNSIAASNQHNTLKHVAIVTGGRSYGMHLGPTLYPAWQQPYREDSPRVPGKNWYHRSEDLLAAANDTWSWSIARPSFIIGDTLNAPLNFGTGIAIYAAIARATKQPLVYPGGAATYDLQWHATDAADIAKLMHWSANAPSAANQAFNVACSDTFRWRDLWPQIAAYFGVDHRCPRRPLNLRKWAKTNAPVWQQIVSTHQLQPTTLRQLFRTTFMEQSFMLTWDTEFALDKAREAGFGRFNRTADTFTALFDKMRAEQIIPSG